VIVLKLNIIATVDLRDARLIVMILVMNIEKRDKYLFYDDVRLVTSSSSSSS